MNRNSASPGTGDKRGIKGENRLPGVCRINGARCVCTRGHEFGGPGRDLTTIVEADLLIQVFQMGLNGFS